MTTPLPDDPHGQRARRSPADRDRFRARLARKWAYLASMTAYVPLRHTDLERPLLELVDQVFDAVAREPLDAEQLAGVGTRLVELHCVEPKSLQVSVDVLTGALLADQDLQHLPRLPERVASAVGALSSGFAGAIRRRTVDQQESMCRALMEVARKATRTAEERAAELGEMSTELALLRGELGHQLLHDALTGLPNQQYLTTRLEEVLNSGWQTTLYRLELNGLPVINDGVGRHRGDGLLRAAAGRILAVVQDETAMVARLDGANFAILQDTHTGPDPRTMVGLLGQALAEPAYVDELGLAATVNVGVVQSPPHRADPVGLLHAADLALRHARNKGPGHWSLRRPDEDAGDQRMLRLAAIMPGAFETGQLTVGYRLRVRLADEDPMADPVAIDAFVSWPQAERAGRPPERCVELAEPTGLSRQLGRWLLRSAAERLRSWSDRSGTGLPLSVSLSPDQSCAPDLAGTVLGVLDGTGLAPERLHLAMPAAEVFHGRQQAVANLTALAAAGVRTAVHDFGGAAGEVARLADLPLHSVRVGPGLTAQAGRAGQDHRVAEALAGLVTFAHLAGLTVSVDGIRSSREAAWWRLAHADSATGPLFGTPQQGDPADIAALFSGQHVP